MLTHVGPPSWRSSSDARPRCPRAASDDWRTDVHEPGYCAMYDLCGSRDDGDALNCASNVPAATPDAGAVSKLQAVCPRLASELGDGARLCCSERQLDLIQRQIQIANIFLVGCPACSANFKH